MTLTFFHAMRNPHSLHSNEILGRCNSFCSYSQVWSSFILILSCLNLLPNLWLSLDSGSETWSSGWNLGQLFTISFLFFSSISYWLTLWPLASWELVLGDQDKQRLDKVFGGQHPNACPFMGWFWSLLETNIHLSMPDPSNTLSCWPFVTHTLTSASFPMPASPACSWWAPWQFQLSSTGPASGHRKHTPLPHGWRRFSCSHAVHRGSFGTDRGLRMFAQQWLGH